MMIPHDIRDGFWLGVIPGQMKPCLSLSRGAERKETFSQKAQLANRKIITNPRVSKNATKS